MSAKVYIAPIGLGCVFLAEHESGEAGAGATEPRLQLGLRLVNGEFDLGEKASSFDEALAGFAQRPNVNPEIVWRIPRDLDKWLGPLECNFSDFLNTAWWEI